MADKKFYIPCLDGIRAIAFLIVFLSHAGYGKIIPGAFGVSIFFFLSGYLITTLLRVEFDKRGTINLQKFYFRRLIRIFPPLYLVILIASILTQLGVLQGTFLTPIGVISQIFCFNNYHAISLNSYDGQAPGTAILWAVAIEVHFYLLFPIFYLFLRRHISSQLKQMLVILSICGIALLWRCILVYKFNAPELRTYIATDTRIDGILFGSILAIYGNPVLDKVNNSSRWWIGWLAVSLGVLVFSIVFRNPQFRETFRYTIQSAALIPVFVAMIRYPNKSIFNWLQTEWLKWYGKLSYALYLVHLSIIFGLQRTNLPMGVVIILSFALSTLLGAVIYYYLEMPFERLKNKMVFASSQR
jgi:peptidoglycan/LPS O-acetylase OafA/YrhL